MVDQDELDRMRREKHAALASLGLLLLLQETGSTLSERRAVGLVRLACAEVFGVEVGRRGGLDIVEVMRETDAFERVPDGIKASQKGLEHAVAVRSRLAGTPLLFRALACAKAMRCETCASKGFVASKVLGPTGERMHAACGECGGDGLRAITKGRKDGDGNNDGGSASRPAGDEPD